MLINIQNMTLNDTLAFMRFLNKKGYVCSLGALNCKACMIVREDI